MSADRYTSIYHLTKTGWVAGAEGCYLSNTAIAANLPPVDRLLTLRYEESTPYYKTHHSCHVDFITPKQYEKLLWAVLTYGAYPPAMAAEIDEYRQDAQLAKILAGTFPRKTESVTN